MKVTAFNGSPRGEKSITNIMVSHFLEGMKKAGAETEQIFLCHHDVKPCIGCFSCWFVHPGKCGLKDDLNSLLEKYLQSDIVVYASPVYVSSVTGIMKNFIDRTLPACEPYISITEKGLPTHNSRYEKDPKIVLMANAGFPQMFHFEYFRSIFSYLEKISDIEIVAEIYRDMGPALSIDNVLFNMIKNNYLNLLKEAGKEVIINGRLSEEARKELEKPLIPEQAYVEEANRHMKKMLQKLESCQG